MRKTGRCIKCGAYLDEEDKYCSICGKKVGMINISFKPMQCLYGPLIIYDCDCKNCGKNWTSSWFGINNTKYCPNCGSEVQRTKVSKNEDD